MTDHNLSKDRCAHGSEQKKNSTACDSPVYNERGMIAGSYPDLQGLDIFERIRRLHPLGFASPESLIRPVLQSIELALLNLDDLVARSTCDLEKNDPAECVIKMRWARGFHQMLLSLSLIPSRLGAAIHDKGEGSTVSVAESPAFDQYFENLKQLDIVVKRFASEGRINIQEILNTTPLDDQYFNLLHLIRVCNHDSTIWEENLSQVNIPLANTNYSDFVIPHGMRAAFYDRPLKGGKRCSTVTFTMWC